MPSSSALASRDRVDLVGGNKARARKKPKGATRKRKPNKLSQLTRFAAIGLSGTVVVGILVNALWMQKGHHPAPLLGRPALAASGSPGLGGSPGSSGSPAADQQAMQVAAANRTTDNARQAAPLAASPVNQPAALPQPTATFPEAAGEAARPAKRTVNKPEPVRAHTDDAIARLIASNGSYQSTGTATAQRHKTVAARHEKKKETAERRT